MTQSAEAGQGGTNASQRSKAAQSNSATYQQHPHSAKMLNAVGNVVHQIQEVTGLGKSEDEHKQQDDTQQQRGDDQAPAGPGQQDDDDQAAPEFTSKEPQPSRKEVVTTRQDDVPLPTEDDKEAAADQQQPELEAPAEEEAQEQEQESTDTVPAQPPAASELAAPTAACESNEGSSPAPSSDKPLNQLRNMGGGSVRLPSTPKQWKKDRSSWHPDAAGVQYPPGFFINKRRSPSWV